MHGLKTEAGDIQTYKVERKGFSDMVNVHVFRCFVPASP